MTVAQRLQRRRRKRKSLAEPVPGGRPAEATSANAYTLNLWGVDEDRTLAEREEGGEEQRDKERDNRMLEEKKVKLLLEWSGAKACAQTLTDPLSPTVLYKSTPTNLKAFHFVA